MVRRHFLRTEHGLTQSNTLIPLAFLLLSRIDDPMRPGHNVASTTFQIQHIARAFRDGFLSLGRHNHDKEHPTRLSRLVSAHVCTCVCVCVHVLESCQCVYSHVLCFSVCGGDRCTETMAFFFSCDPIRLKTVLGLKNFDWMPVQERKNEFGNCKCETTIERKKP